MDTAGLVAVDLHVHSALSPCAAAEMTPPAVLLTAERRGVRVVGIVDHSSAGNAAAFLEAAPAFRVRVLVGLEVETAEGVHVLALFDSVEPARHLEDLVVAHQPPLANRPEYFGEQWLVDEWGERQGEEPRLLAVGCDLGLDKLLRVTQDYGGLALPAHVDRPGNGLLSLLGFVPPHLPAPALEITRFITPAQARERWPQLAAFPLLTGSDAHCLADLGAGATMLPEDLARADLPVREWGRQVADYLRRETGGGHA